LEGTAFRPSRGAKRSMAKRMIVTLGIAMAIIATLGFVKFKQIQTAIAEGAAFQPPPEAVTTIIASEAEWPATLSAIGTMVAVQGVTVSADLPGTVDRILFESGQAVKAGDVLAVLDTRQEQAQLAALEAQRDLCRGFSTNTSSRRRSSIAPARNFDRRMPVSARYERSSTAKTSVPRFREFWACVR